MQAFIEQNSHQIVKKMSQTVLQQFHAVFRTFLGEKRNKWVFPELNEYQKLSFEVCSIICVRKTNDPFLTELSLVKKIGSLIANNLVACK